MNLRTRVEFDEKLIEYDHESGLRVQVVPKPGFIKSLPYLL